MVVKERNREEHPQSGRIAEAATAAEEQMAFYLRRAFGSEPNVSVLNDLRLPFGENDCAQIDHLLVHPYGFVLVESKSVTGSVVINEHGEWCRVYGDGRRAGMRSPVVQAGMQADALRRLLNGHFAKAGQQPSVAGGGLFDRVPFDVLVAIADQGLIERRCAVPEVHKADAVPAAARALIAGHESSRGQKGPRLDVPARAAISDFLVKRHMPSRGRPTPPAAGEAITPRRRAPGSTPAPGLAPARPAVTATTATAASAAAGQAKRCRFCGSGSLHLQHGRYGYYFRCIRCTRNTPIDFTCPHCSQKARVRKAGLNFYRECPACRSSELFYVNASLADLDDPSGGGS